MDGDRRVAGPVRTHVRQAEARRQHEVDLHRRQRLLAPVRVVHLHVDLRPVERGLAVLLVVLDADRPERGAQHVGAARPAAVVVDELLSVAAQRQPPARRLDAEHVMSAAYELQRGDHLRVELILAAEHVAVVERHRPHA